MKVKPAHITEFLKFQRFVDELQHRLIEYERFKICTTGCGSILHDNFRPCLYEYAAHVFFESKKNKLCNHSLAEASGEECHTRRQPDNCTQLAAGEVTGNGEVPNDNH